MTDRRDYLYNTGDISDIAQHRRELNCETAFHDFCARIPGDENAPRRMTYHCPFSSPNSSMFDVGRDYTNHVKLVHTKRNLRAVLALEPLGISGCRVTPRTATHQDLRRMALQMPGLWEGGRRL